MSWANGYPADINYRVGFYRNLAPSHLAMICVLQGVEPPRSPFTYLELGCGAGFSTLMLAASNPSDTFIGVDFSPSHIAEANGLKAEADIRNVHFIEASFDDINLISMLPPCDFVSLHGVYSWVGPRQRECIRDILSKRLKTGGLFYISYNNMVAAGFEIVLQRALHELSRAETPGSLKAAFHKLNQMRLLGADYFRHNPSLTRLMEDIGNKDPSYLVHEYLTDHWTPYFFQDLAREMADCKLSFLGAAAPADNQDEFVASAEMMSILKSEDDPNVQAFLADIASNRRFRNDIFVRGSRRMESGHRIAHLRNTVFALATRRSDIDFRVKIGRGMLELRRPIFRAIVDHLTGAAKILEQVNFDDSSLVEAITLLSQGAIIHPAALGHIEFSAGRRLNQVIFSTEQRRMQYGFAAAPLIGSAIPVAAADRVALAAQLSDTLVPHTTVKPENDTVSSVADKVQHWQSLRIID